MSPLAACRCLAQKTFFASPFERQRLERYLIWPRTWAASHITFISLNNLFTGDHISITFQSHFTSSTQAFFHRPQRIVLDHLYIVLSAHRSHFSRAQPLYVPRSSAGRSKYTVTPDSILTNHPLCRWDVFLHFLFPLLIIASRMQANVYPVKGFVKQNCHCPSDYCTMPTPMLQNVNRIGRAAWTFQCWSSHAPIIAASKLLLKYIGGTRNQRGKNVPMHTRTSSTLNFSRPWYAFSTTVLVWSWHPGGSWLACHVYSSHAPRLHSFSYPQTTSHANDPSLKPPVRSSALSLSLSSSRVLCSTRDGQLFSAQYDTAHPPHKSVSALQVHMQCGPTIEPLDFKKINRKVSLRSHNSSALPLNDGSLFRCHGISNATLVCAQS